jgi:hypothetical protein
VDRVLDLDISALVHILRAARSAVAAAGKQTCNERQDRGLWRIRQSLLQSERPSNSGHEALARRRVGEAILMSRIRILHLDDRPGPRIQPRNKGMLDPHAVRLGHWKVVGSTRRSHRSRVDIGIESPGDRGRSERMGGIFTAAGLDS